MSGSEVWDRVQRTRIRDTCWNFDCEQRQRSHRVAEGCECCGGPSTKKLVQVCDACRKKVIGAGLHLPKMPILDIPRVDGSVVYFVVAESVDRVKIGFAQASNFRDRMSALQTGSPVQLRVARVIAGSRNEEKALHRRWKHAAVGGEWFVWSVIRDEAESLACIPDAWQTATLPERKSTSLKRNPPTACSDCGTRGPRKQDGSEWRCKSCANARLWTSPEYRLMVYLGRCAAGTARPFWLVFCACGRRLGRKTSESGRGSKCYECATGEPIERWEAGMQRRNLSPEPSQV